MFVSKMAPKVGTPEAEAVTAQPTLEFPLSYK